MCYLFFSYAEEEKGKVFDFEVVESTKLKCKMEPDKLRTELGFLSQGYWGQTEDIPWLNRYAIGSKVQSKKIEGSKVTFSYLLVHRLIELILFTHSHKLI